MNAPERPVRPFGMPSIEDSVPHSIEALTRAGDRLVVQHREIMLAAESKAALERAALLDQYRVRMRKLASEADEALRRFDLDDSKRVESDERLLAIYEQIRSG